MVLVVSNNMNRSFPNLTISHCNKYVECVNTGYQYKVVLGEYSNLDSCDPLILY